MSQKATASENASILQAEGNITINQNVSFTEVERICTILFENNFPKLLDDAKKQSEEHVRSFVKIALEKIERSQSTIDIAKLAEPDVQSTFNSAVMTAARKGDKTDLDILAELLSNRLQSGNSDAIDLAIEFAVELIPKLTNAQLNLIALIKYIGEMCVNIPSFLQNDAMYLDDYYRKVYIAFIDNIENFTAGDIYTISSLGAACTFERDKLSFKSSWVRNTYSFIDFTSLPSKYPHLNLVLNFYIENNLHRYTLSTVGQVIGVLLLKKHIFPNFSLSDYVN
ncbi:LPO_1073/Vpar_1526 family protein [Pseudoalteromonas xiamenensis]